MKTRQCYDSNYCEYSYNKPVEKTSCEIIKQSFVQANKNNQVFALIGFLVVIALIIILFVLLKK